MKISRIAALTALTAILISGCQYAIPKIPIPTTTRPPVTTTSAPSTTATPTTTSAPTITTAPSSTLTSAPTTTPTEPGATTAAARFGWGDALPASDEFDYTGAPDPQRWWTAGECWPANNTAMGGRCASHSTVGNGFLRQSGTADGKTGWLASKTGQRFGRWETRARVLTNGPGKEMHPVLLAWPDSDAWPSGGELDYFEIDGGGVTHIRAYIHHPTSSGVVQDTYTSPTAIDVGQWHSYALEWTPTAINGYIDGQLWFHDTDPAAQPPGPMHATIQLDLFESPPGIQPTSLDVDWLRIYAP